MGQGRTQTEGRTRRKRARNASRADRVSSGSHLYLALDLKVEGFIPLGVWAVGDGPGPHLLVRGSGKPEAYIAVSLAHFPGRKGCTARVRTSSGPGRESMDIKWNLRQISSRARPRELQLLFWLLERQFCPRTLRRSQLTGWPRSH